MNDSGWAHDDRNREVLLALRRLLAEKGQEHTPDGLANILEFVASRVEQVPDGACLLCGLAPRDPVFCTRCVDHFELDR